MDQQQHEAVKSRTYTKLKYRSIQLDEPHGINTRGSDLQRVHQESLFFHLFEACGVLLQDLDAPDHL